jgi:hypothetical protein
LNPIKTALGSLARRIGDAHLGESRIHDVCAVTGAADDATAGVYRYDQLIVLRRTQMPAVLLEAGSIINRDEEAAMSSPERRALISAAVTSAVETYCDAHAIRPEPVRVAHPEPVRTVHPEPVRAVHSEPARPAVTAVAAKTTTRPTGASWLMNLFTRQSSTNARK